MTACPLLLLLSLPRSLHLIELRLFLHHKVLILVLFALSFIPNTLSSFSESTCRTRSLLHLLRTPFPLPKENPPRFRSTSPNSGRGPLFLFQAFVCGLLAYFFFHEKRRLRLPLLPQRGSLDWSGFSVPRRPERLLRRPWSQEPFHRLSSPLFFFFFFLFLRRDASPRPLQTVRDACRLEVFWSNSSFCGPLSLTL